MLSVDFYKSMVDNYRFVQYIKKDKTKVLVVVANAKKGQICFYSYNLEY